MVNFSSDIDGLQKEKHVVPNGNILVTATAAAAADQPTLMQ